VRAPSDPRVVLAEANARTLTYCGKGLGIAYDTSNAGVAVEAVGDNDRLFSMKVPMSKRREKLVLSNARYVTTLPISSVAVQAPVVESQNLIVLSSDAKASIFKSYENATEVTLLLYPSSVWMYVSQSN
jgi:hypothetical protein